MKVVVLDAGPIINLSMNGLLYILEGLKKKTKVRFIITEAVKREVTDKPVTIKKFELGALRIKELIAQKVLEFPEAIGISNAEVQERMHALMSSANHTIKVHHHWVHLVSDGEMSAIACSELCTQKGIDNLVVIDERTARTLYEKPENLELLMTKKLHKRARLAGKPRGSGFRFIRSSELVYVAHKKNLVKLKDPKALEALLYATKFKGSAISFEEIDVLKGL